MLAEILHITKPSCLHQVTELFLMAHAKNHGKTTAYEL
jgi:hypothetical protein